VVRDVSGVIRHAISDGNGSGGGYLSAFGGGADGALATIHTLGTFIYFLYTSSNIAYLGSSTYNTAESRKHLFTYERGQDVVTHMACIVRDV